MADEHDDDLPIDALHNDEREGEAADTDDISIEIEGEEPGEETPLVRTLRARARDLARQVAEKERTEQAKASIVVGEKPTLESCDWDADKFEADLDGWKERKRKADEQAREAETQTAARNHAYERSMNSYRGKAAQLGVKDFDEAEAAVRSSLPEMLQSVVIQYAKDPAKVVYALAKHPGRMAKLADESDPIRFALAIDELERNLKVVNRRKPPEPESETIQRGSAPLSRAASDKRAEKLLADAQRTGNMTPYSEYMRAQRRAAR